MVKRLIFLIYSHFSACDAERQTKQQHTGASAAPGLLKSLRLLSSSSPALTSLPQSSSTLPYGNPSANVPVTFLLQSSETISYVTDALSSPTC